MPEPGPHIFDHAPRPGPLNWDWKCLECDAPVSAHAGWFGRWKWRRARAALDRQIARDSAAGRRTTMTLPSSGGDTSKLAAAMENLDRQSIFPMPEMDYGLKRGIEALAATAAEPEPPEFWTCWRCTHPLCTRLAQSWEIDHARFLLRHAGRGDNRERYYRRLEGTALELTLREDDPPKCIGVHQTGGNYFSHSAAPMELVEVAVVAEGKYLHDQSDQNQEDPAWAKSE